MLDPLSVCIPTQGFGAPPIPVLPQRKLLQPSPDHPDDYILEMDYSSVSNFLSCPRSAENYSILSRESNGPSSATDFGKLFHLCEEERLKHGWSEATKAKQFELIEQHFLTHPVSPSDHRTAERMIAVLDRYNKIYNETTPDGWPGKVQEVEVPFKVPLCTVAVNAELPYPQGQICTIDAIPSLTKGLPVRNIHCIYTGRIDATLSDSNLSWVVDHKTASRGGSQFVEAFRLSRQTLGYTWAASKIFDQPFAGLILNAIVIKTPTKLLFNNTDYERHSFFYSQDLLDEWEEGMRHILSDFVHCLARGYFPQSARSFISPCAMCDYQENCTLPKAQRGADLASDLYRNVTWNPMD